MIGLDNYLWYLKATHFIIPLLITIGIVLRWNTASKARQPLAFLFFVLALFNAVDVMLTMFYDLHPFILRSGVGLGYSFGSLYNGMSIAIFAYLYARAIFKPMKNPIKTLLLTNCIPIASFAIYLFLLSLGYAPVPNYNFGDLIENMFVNPFVLLWLITMVCFEVFAVCIGLITFKWMFIHRRNIKNNFSQLGGFRYYYVYFTHAAFCLTIPLGLWIMTVEATLVVEIISALSFAIILILLFIFSTLQQDIYSVDSPMIDVDDDVDDECEHEMATKNITTNDRRIIERLRVLIDEEKIYISSDLTAETLATKLGVSRKKLYLFFKEYNGETFSDYINGCRLDYAAKLLNDAEFSNRTILEISEISGFSTISTFNKLFKEKYLMTPTQYRSCSLIT